MKKYYPLLVFVFALTTASAQQRIKLLNYDVNWQPTELKKAYYHVEQVKYNDTCFEWNYYLSGHPRWLSVQFKDEKGTVKHGNYYTYTDDGYRDSSCEYKDGKPHGDWYINASNHRTLKKLEYVDGQLISEKDSATLTKEREAAAKKTSPEPGAGNTTTFTKVEVESSFEGGAQGWIKYLEKNFRYPDESIKRRARGMVVVQFIVNQQGKVESPEIYKSVEYFIDREALRLITRSPDWTPATQDGRKVKSYKRQPVTFWLE
ncbi:MAG TPA: energy transducer TonB [Chitinophagaceae bacterium]|nr:energy transducer TonB [Chitinophagaceae bacterium]